MPIIDAVNRIERKRYEAKDNPKEDYARVEIDLGSIVGTNIEFTLNGNYLAKISYDGNTTVYFRIDNRHAAKVYAKEFKMLRREFKTLWITNPTAQVGKKLILQIGESDYAEIVPDDWGERINDSIETIEDAVKVDDASLVVGTDKVMLVGGYAVNDPNTDPVDEGDAAIVALTLGREMRVESMPPKMETDMLSATTDAETDTIAAPGVGSAIEVLGWQIVETVDAAATITDPAMLRFDATQYLWLGVTVEPGAIKEYMTQLSGIRSRGADNEALTLTNANVGAGSTTVTAVIYYRIVGV